MSDFKDKITKQVEIIDSVISNEQEKKTVMGAIQELIKDFTIRLVQMSERLNEQDEKITELYDLVTNIETNVFGDDEEDTAFGTCPYCGEEIPLTIKDENFADIECPLCHNIIEINIDDDTK